MSVRMANHLSALRTSCAALMSSLQDDAARRQLELVISNLNGLIAEAKTLPALEARALASYRALLSEMPADLAAARAAVDKMLKASSDAPEASVLQLLRNVVAIEQALSVGSTQALSAERESSSAVPKNQDAPSGSPDAGAISAYLSSLFGATVSVIRIATVSLGYSKATFMLEVQSSSAVPRELVIRMDRAGSMLGTTVVDEYPILKVLHASGVTVPRPYGLEKTGSVLGQAFMVVARVHGRNVGSHFAFPPPNPDLCTIFGRALAQIHRIPVAQFGDALPGSRQSVREQLAADIDHYYADWNALQLELPIMEAAFQWLRRHIEEVATGPRVLLHGDFSLSNLLISDENEVAAILDWEFARLGQPASDLGWFYEAATRLASWQHFLDAYQNAGGILPAQRQLKFFALWSAVKLAVMGYQFKIGFDRGQLTDIKQAFVSINHGAECIRRVSDRLNQMLT